MVQNEDWMVGGARSPRALCLNSKGYEKQLRVFWGAERRGVTGSDIHFEYTLVAGMKWIGEYDNDEGWSIGKTFIATQKGSDSTLD